jgi:hypothetical protein
MLTGLVRAAAIALGGIALVSTSCGPPTAPASALPGGGMDPPPLAISGGAPAEPPARICGNERELDGPAVPPAHAVVVPAGDNSSFDWARPGATFWFAPGVHTLGEDAFSQIIPADGSTFIGGPRAVLDGRHVNRYAFAQQASDVRIAFLTIRGFGRGADNHNEGVVNHDAGDRWVIEHNTVVDNDGAGVFVGDGNLLRRNCLKDNGQYGFSVYEPDGVVNITIDHNEVVGNNRDDWESRIDGCGCSGGAKFWDAQAATVTGNWVHDNYGPGLWADHNNRDFLFEGNYFNNNQDEALFYEVSYNAEIRDNTFRLNTIRKGLRYANDGDLFPVSAVYISESGGDERVAGRPTISIHRNVFEDNWSGVTVWENADRFCGNGSTPGCTLGTNATEATCVQPGIARPPLYDDCRWKSKNVLVYDNDFRVDPSAIGCRASWCARQALLSNFGTWPAWSPYQGEVVQDAITFEQGNRWSDNRYVGPWKFVVRDTAGLVDFASWQAAPYGQDQGSTIG